MRASRCYAAVASAIAAASVVLAGAVRAQDAEESFFKGRNIRLVVGYAPGGGFDIYARMIAPYLGKALGANVIVENQPGAGNLTALNNIMVAPADGSRIMLANGSAGAMAQLTRQPGVNYDLSKVGHLGTIVASPAIWLVAPYSSITTPNDAIEAKKTITWASSGPTGLADGAAFTCEALGLQCKIVIGYPGSNEAAMAVSKGEMDAICISDISSNNYVKSGLARAVVTMGHKRSRFFPDTPTIFERVNLNVEQQWLLDFRDTIEELGRILIAPPNVPPARLAYLQDAARRALNDPALIAEGERTQYYVGYTDAQANREAAQRVVGSITDEQRRKVNQIMSSIR